MDFRVLKLNCVGKDVEGWQRILKGYGYNVTVDGKFGPDTKSKTVALQKKLGITGDGEVGKITMSKALGLN